MIYASILLLATVAGVDAFGRFTEPSDICADPNQYTGEIVAQTICAWALQEGEPCSGYEHILDEVSICDGASPCNVCIVTDSYENSASCLADHPGAYFSSESCDQAVISMLSDHGGKSVGKLCNHEEDSSDLYDLADKCCTDRKSACEIVHGHAICDDPSGFDSTMVLGVHCVKFITNSTECPSGFMVMPLGENSLVCFGEVDSAEDCSAYPGFMASEETCGSKVTELDHADDDFCESEENAERLEELRECCTSNMKTKCDSSYASLCVDPNDFTPGAVTEKTCINFVATEAECPVADGFVLYPYPGGEDSPCAFLGLGDTCFYCMLSMNPSDPDANCVESYPGFHLNSNTCSENVANLMESHDSLEDACSSEDRGDIIALTQSCCSGNTNSPCFA